MANFDEQDELAVSSNIGELEHHIHKVFSSVRVPGEDFVYNSSNDYSTILDDYCNDQVSSCQPPLLLLGESGTGKSAMLSNWLHKRRLETIRTRLGNEDFIFWHAVGCSRQSTYVHNFLRRLITDLKNRFELSREVPIQPERLSWELPRFLDLAARRGKIIIVIDGVTRLLQDDDSEATLTWLPLEYAPNIRFIMSATLPDDVETTLDPKQNPETSDDSRRGSTEMGKPTPLSVTLSDDNTEESARHEANNRKKGRILSALERRKWKILRIRCLEKSSSKSIVNMFIEKTVHAEVSNLATGPNAGMAKEAPGTMPEDGVPGFLLYDSQIQALLSHPLGGNPMFIRTFLRCAHLVCSRGFNIWRVWDDWLRSDSIPELFHRIIELLEVGSSSSEMISKEAIRRTYNEGGFGALKVKYRWHPSFQISMITVPNDDDDFSQFVIDTEDGTGNPDGTVRKAGTNKDQSVLLSLGDQQWLSAVDDAESKFQDAKKKADVLIKDVIVKTQNKRASRSRLSPPPSGSVVTAVLKQVDAIRRGSEADSVDSANESSSGRLCSLTGSLKHEESNAAAEKLAAVLEGVDATTLDDDDLKNEADAGDTRAASRRRKIQEKTKLMASSKNRKNSTNSQKSSIDPSVDGHLLPLYLKGGINIPGLGVLLGHALSLLYVARHGLKEHELWTLLASLNPDVSKNEFGDAEELGSQSTNSMQPSKMKWMLTAPNRHLLTDMHTEQGALLDVWRGDDIHHSNYASVAQLTNGLKKVFPQYGPPEMQMLLELLSLDPRGPNPSAYFQLDPSAYLRDMHKGSRMKVNYAELIRRVNVLERNRRKIDQRARLAAKSKFSSKDADHMNVVPSLANPTKANDSRSQNSLDDISQFSNDSGMDFDNISLGPIVEETLLIVLSALGVLHSPENQVLVLPLDSGMFRNVVKERFVDRLGGEAVWHGYLIRHFQRERSSMRRCEELPWHLQLCRKWFGLKDTLADLQTFQLMYESDLKDELLRYWTTLTEGPLYVTDEAHRIAVAATSLKASASGNAMMGETGKQRMDDKDRLRTLSALDAAAALGLTEKEARKQLLMGQVAPFDIVEEFNRSLENWLLATHASDEELSSIIGQIAKFLGEFSRQCKPFPTFLRERVDMKTLDLLGITFDDVQDKKLVEDEKALEEDMLINASIIENKDVQTFPTPQQVASNLYPYLRWVWIQFPWMALKNCSDIGKKIVTRKMEMKVAMQELGRVPKNDQSAPGSGGQTKSPFSIGAGIEQFHYSLAMESSADEEKEKRQWELLKKDPKNAVFRVTPSRRSAELTASSMRVSKKLGPVKATAEILHHEDCSLGGAESENINLSVFKFRRTIDDELQAIRSIPFAHHAGRSLKHQSLFPTIEAEKRNQHRLRDEDYQDPTPKMPMIGSKADLSDCSGVDLTLEEELGNIIEKERLARYNEHHVQAIPVSEREATFQRESERMVKLRALSDRCVAVRRERQKVKKDLIYKLNLREQEDVDALEQRQEGEDQFADYQAKIAVLNVALNEASEANEGLKSILELLTSCPPYIDARLELLEQRVVLARQQLEDLIQCRKKMYIDKERIERVKITQIKTVMRHYRDARERVAAKREKFLSQNSHFFEEDYSYSHSHSYSSVSSSMESSIADTNPAQVNPASGMIANQHSKTPLPGTMTHGSSKQIINIDTEPEKLGKIHGIKSPQENKSARLSNLSDHSGRRKSFALPGSTHKSMASGLPQHRSKRHRNNEKRGQLEQSKYTFNDQAILEQSMASLSEKVKEDQKHKIVENAREVQSKMMVENLLSKTGSQSVEDFLKRYRAAQNVTDNVKSIMNLADAKLLQLQNEHSDLYETIGTSLFENAVVDDNDGSTQDDDRMTVNTFESDGESKSIPVAEKDMRVVDQEIFSAEAKVVHWQKQCEKAYGLLRDLRGGIDTVSSQLTKNYKLLHNLPRNDYVSAGKTDEDLIKSLSWVEERLASVNDAMTLDPNKPTGSAITDETKPLPDRQIEAAALIQTLVLKKSPANSARKGKMRGVDIDNELYRSQLKTVRIMPLDVDDRYKTEIEDVERKRDYTAEMREYRERNEVDVDEAEGVRNFLDDALKTHDSQVALRRNNTIIMGINKSQMKNIPLRDLLRYSKESHRIEGYGYAVDSLMQSDELDIAQPSPRKKKEHTYSIQMRSPVRGGEPRREEFSVKIDDNDMPSRADIKKRATRVTHAAAVTTERMRAGMFVNDVSE